MWQSWTVTWWISVSTEHVTCSTLEMEIREKERREEGKKGKRKKGFDRKAEMPRH